MKKVIIVGLEGVNGTEVDEAARSGKLPNLAKLMVKGTIIPRVAVDVTPASSWTTLATGTHAQTHGVVQHEDCKAQYIWQAVERTSKQGLALGYPALGRVKNIGAVPEDLVRPTEKDGLYYDRVASYLLSNPDWDIVFVHITATSTSLAQADEYIQKVFSASDLETIRVFVALAEQGEGFAILEGTAIKVGEILGRPVELADVMPTICYIAELPVPAECEGGIIYQALQDPDCKLIELQSCRRNYERLRRSSGSAPMC
jgi:hypothetical protein